MSRSKRYLSRREQLAARDKVHTYIPQESEVQQSFRDQCDLNKIVGRYDKVMRDDFLSTHFDTQGGSYADVSEVPDYRDALHIIRDAQESFNRLPQEWRNEFGNDMRAFVHAIDDPNQRSRLEALGVFKSRDTATPPIHDQVEELAEAQDSDGTRST